MAYEALARKYRPRTFDEVVGQEPIVRTLINAIKESRIHHAYVFSGVRGVGKTTVARIFAKALNCETGPTPSPCLRCDPCLEIAAGRDLDVIEMDAASRTGVDDVRDLIDTTRYAPARDRNKIFIIDEFHMLSKPAFNALLKTLEEPPPRVVFLMATTELHKVLPTVVSRTLQFDFRKVSMAEIAGQLGKIAAAEGVEAPAACLEMLARAADGSVRDAESLLDQAIAFSGAKLVEEDVRTLLGLIPEETVEAFLSASADRDAGSMIRMISMALAEGRDLRIFHAGLLEGVRRLLLVKTLERPSEILGLAAEDEKRLGVLAGRYRTDELLRLFSILAGLEAPLKYSDQPRYLFEAAAIKMAAIADLVPIEDLISRLEEGGAPGGGIPTGGGKGQGAAREPGARGAGAPMPASPARSTDRPVPVPKPQPGRRRSEPASEGVPLAAAADGVPNGAAALATEGSDSRSEAPAVAIEGEGSGVGSGVEASQRDVASQSARREPDDSLSGPRDGNDGPHRGEEFVEGQADDDSGLGSETMSVSPGKPGREERFLSGLRTTKETLSMLIEDAARIAFEGDVLAVLFEDTQAFARKSVEQPANVAILRKVASESEGRPIRVDIRRSVAPVSTAAGRGARRGAGPQDVESRTEGPLLLDGDAADDSAARSGAPGRDAATSRMETSSQTPLLPPRTTEPATVSNGGIRGDAAREHAIPADENGAPEGASSARVPLSTTDARGERPGGPRYQRMQAQALEDPAVKRFVDRFGGRIVEIKEIP